MRNAKCVIRNLFMVVIFMLSLSNLASAADTLEFDSSIGVEKSLTCDGRTVNFIAYENISYVATPASEIQKLSVYIPAEYLRGEMINGYSAKTAPIFLPNGVGGYMPGNILEPVENDRMSGGANASLVALSRGLVVISPAIRGRTTTMNGVYVGKAPAFIVDYKAAVRWIRYNRDRLPAGDVEKIISNGTSAGGALSALLGATGNAPEYQTYLKALGAANERDDIFASSDYCPITNLENADAAYEWIFYGENKYFPAMWQLQDLEARGKKSPEKVALNKPLNADSANNPEAVKNSIDMTAEEIRVSKILRDAFPNYVNSLNLRDNNGNLLTLDKNGDGSFKNFVKQKYIESAQSALDSGKDLSNVDWVVIRNGRVVDVDLKKYPVAVTRMKAAPAFDKLDLSSAENDEFGDSKNEPRHFSTTNIYSTGEFANDGLVALLNPLNFIGRNDVNTAKHFRIRHGAADRDTALAIPAILALTLQNNGVEVDFFSPWGQGHGGDYDLPELFDWIDSVCKD